MRRAAGASAGALLLLTAPAPAPAVASPLAQASGPPRATVLATGLDNPRGIVFGPDGALYVAEAGHAGRTCIPDRFCTGRTAAIARLTPADGRLARVVRRLPSFGDATGAFASGAADVAVAPDGTIHTIVTSLGRRIPARVPRASRPYVGRIVSAAANGPHRLGPRVDRIEFADNPDGENEDANPYSIARLGDRLYVADAGGNDLLSVPANGGGPVVAHAVFPKAAPNAQSVPTVVRPGPGGMLYVGELSGDAAPNGRARVWRVDPAAPGARPVLHAKGFSRITGLAFGPDGSLYVSEFSRDLAKGRAAGRVVHVRPDGSRRAIGASVLRFPSGVAVGPDGDLYVANWSGATARPVRAGPARGRTGQIVRFDLP